ncbi:MAG TPA: DNA mismatch repair endonuclease MutL, partial [Ktedonobacteraceae bacterium]|nr:DNA mismatch repair endonuclease MutL [Ktedonobacteraceae bacterium]
HLLEQYALAYPGIRFTVSSEGRQIFSTPGDGQLTSVLIEIYGLAVTEQMVPISSLDGNDDDPERPVATGYTSLPACYKSTRQHMSFFVNHRWVHSRMLSYAVEEAYHSLLLPGRHPISVINISVDPTQIDVNVHPAKTEIRFLKERRIYSAILRAIRGAVLTEATVPTWGGNNARVVQIAATTQVEKVSIEETVTPISDIPAPSSHTKEEHETEISESALLPQDSPWLTVTEEETGTKPPSFSRLWQGHVNLKDHTGGTNSRNLSLLPVEEEVSKEQPETPALTVAPPVQGAPAAFAHPELLPATRPVEAVAPLPLEALLPMKQELVDGQSRLPNLRVIGQFAQSYIITEGQDGLYLIDQHAAHERILLERMVAALQARASLSQLLLTPISLKLSPVELSAIEEHTAQLKNIGFDLDIEDNTVLVKAVPQVLIKQMNARSLQELLTELTEPESPGHAETWEEHALANVACKAAIKANYFLTSSEMREMLNQLASTKAPYSCCHGRPTTVRFGLAALEREFGRR